MISEEERNAIGQCKLLLAGDITLHILDDDGGTAYAGIVNKEYNKDLETVLNLIETQNKMINVLADKICELDVDCTCDNFLPKDWKCMEYRTCKECIKEWARKKIENEKRKRKKYQHKYYLEVTKKKRQEKRNQTKAKESENE